MSAQERYDEERTGEEPTGEERNERERQGGRSAGDADPGSGMGGTGEADPGMGMGGTADLIRSRDDDAGGMDQQAGETAGEAGDAGTEENAPLLPQAGADRFRADWEAIQVGFVDEPRQSVERADQLVAELMRVLAEGFAETRSSLEADWDRGDDVSTEELRVTLQRYRSFFQRLLAA